MVYASQGEDNLSRVKFDLISHFVEKKIVVLTTQLSHFSVVQLLLRYYFSSSKSFCGEGGYCCSKRYPKECPAHVHNFVRDSESNGHVCVGKASEVIYISIVRMLS